MHTYKEITNELLNNLVNHIEIIVEDELFDIGEYCETDVDFLQEVRETRDEILFTLVAKIKLKYLNKYTQD